MGLPKLIRDRIRDILIEFKWFIKEFTYIERAAYSL